LFAGSADAQSDYSTPETAMTRHIGFHLALAFVITASSAQAQSSTFMAPRGSAPPPTSISTEGIALNSVLPSRDVADAPRASQSSIGNQETTGSRAKESASDQPEMATGLDLQGPPERFLASETPE
jgi:hypothetical protein